MEAATPLRSAHVKVLADRVVIDGVVVTDPTVVELVRRRAEAGEDPAQVVTDAVEIGARVLDREQTGAQADFVRAEFVKASAEVETAFADKARVVAQFFNDKVDEVFAAESGTLHKSMERHFSDGSSEAVQHRVRAVVDEVMRQSREDLAKQFSATGDNNPLAQFQRGVLGVMKQGADRQDVALQRLYEKLEATQLEVARLHAEREKQASLAAESARGTAKGRTFEEAVFDALDRIALAQGDDCEAVGDFKGTTRRTGDITVGIDGCAGAARGRLVFEVKTGRLSRREMVDELDRARAERDADFAVLVVPSEEKVPARTQALREINGDKLVVCFDPEEGSTLGLEVAYALARARVLMARGSGEGVDATAVREAVERATGAMGDVQRVKQQLTGATTSIENARKIVDSLAAAVRAHLGSIEALLDAAEADQPAVAAPDVAPGPTGSAAAPARDPLGPSTAAAGADGPAPAAPPAASSAHVPFPGQTALLD